MNSSDISNADFPKSAIFSLVDVSLLDIMRGATADLYEDFRSSVMANDSFVTRDHYVKHLYAFHQTLSSLMENISWPILEAQGLAHAKQRLDRCRNIRKDLESLGDSGPVKKLNQDEDKNHEQCLATSIGYVYVIEGSVHLGRDMAAAFLAADIGITANQTTFLRGYGKDTYTMWREVLIWLDRYECDDALKLKARDAAVNAFELLSTALTPKS